MQTEGIRPCSCDGTRDSVETKAAKSGFTLYWQVRCARCRRETAKHKTLESAVQEWNQQAEAE